MKKIRITYDFDTEPASEDVKGPEHVGSIRVTLRQTGPVYVAEKMELVFQEDDGAGANDGVLCHAIRHQALQAVASLPNHLVFKSTQDHAIASVQDDARDRGVTVHLTLVEVANGQ